MSSVGSGHPHLSKKVDSVCSGLRFVRVGGMLLYIAMNDVARYSSLIPGVT